MELYHRVRGQVRANPGGFVPVNHLVFLLAQPLLGRLLGGGGGTDIVRVIYLCMATRMCDVSIMHARTTHVSSFSTPMK